MAIVTNARLGITLEQTAADWFARAVAAGCPLQVNSSYRDPKAQLTLFLDNYTSEFSISAKYDRRTYQGNSYWRRTARVSTGAKTIAVAPPGTSRHESGLAIDLGVDARRWMAAHGLAFGYVNPDWAQQVATFEPWHYEFDPTIIQEDDMQADERAALFAIQRALQPGIAGERTDGEFAAFARELRNQIQTTVKDTTPAAADTTALAAIARTLEPGIAGKRSDGEFAAFVREVRNFIVTEVRAAASTTPVSVEIDYAALAKAVNDDAARRLAE